MSLAVLGVMSKGDLSTAWLEAADVSRSGLSLGEPSVRE